MKIDRGIVGTLLALVLAGPVWGQETGDSIVDVALERTAGGALALEITVADGWYVYATEPGPSGLPLTVTWIPGGAAAASSAVWPVADTVLSSGQRLATYRGRLRVVLDEPRQPSDIVEVRWAACRGDLCVPGVTRVALPRLLQRPVR